MNNAVDVVGAAESALGRQLVAPGVHEMAGGYSWKTYLVSDGSSAQAVVRVAPKGGTLDPYDPNDERRALGAVMGAVPAPRVLHVESDPSVYGAPLQVQTVGSGSTVKLSSVHSLAERSAYRSALAVGLGRLHRNGEPARLSTVGSTGEAIQWLIEREVEHYVRVAPARYPGFEIGLRWLLSNLPGGDAAPVVCHGDYRFQNVLWNAPGEIGTVLDWERAWAGDPMCDIAFTRQFSGWAAIDGDAVAVYEESAGRVIDESAMDFYLKLERWRSYTASMRGLAAISTGRSNRPELIVIGEAGLVGMWSLVEWLEDDLVALPETLAVRSSDYRDGMTDSRRIEVAESLAFDDPQRSHLLDDDRDSEFVKRSVDQLRSLPGIPHLDEVLKIQDPTRAWEGAYSVLTSEAAHSGGMLREALRALGQRFTARPMYFKEMKWR
jgi:aminoglycoside phosphotransferase (APT) family kinase protein